MFSWPVLFLFATLASIYFIRTVRRFVLFLLGSSIGHAWLLYRYCTKDTEARKQKRSYLEQNPVWKERNEAVKAGKIPAAVTNSLNSPTHTTPGTTALPPASPI